jgi:hypothetical protein
MRARFLAATLSVFVLAGSTAWSDGLVYKLPADGSWVQFDLKAAAGRDGQSRDMTGTLRVSSVGSSEEDGTKCRWVEIKMTMVVGDKERVIIAKTLIPENDLQRGKSPSDNIVRGWIRMRPEGDAVKLTDSNKGPLPGFLSGPLKDSKKLKAAEIKSPLGNLMCEGVSGYVEFKENSNDNRIDFENRLHEKAPFGVVSSTMNVAVKRDGEVRESIKMVLTLSETGAGAKTELPDSN